MTSLKPDDPFVDLKILPSASRGFFFGLPSPRFGGVVESFGASSAVGSGSGTSSLFSS